MKRAVPWLAIGLLGSGCPTTNVVLGDDVPDDGSRAGSSGGDGGSGAGGIAGGCAGIAGFNCGGVGGGPGCAPSEDALQGCEHFLPASLLYNYNACLNAQDGTDGSVALQCEGYAPCSYQHEGCLDYYSGGTAGSPHVCAGEPGSVEWLADCGGLGYYGPDITAGAGGAAGGAGTGAAGGAGIGCDPAIDSCVAGAGGSAGVAGVAGTTAGATAGTGAVGEAGTIGGVGGGPAGAGGESGSTAGAGGTGAGAGAGAGGATAGESG